MDQLRAYLNSLSSDEQLAFAARVAHLADTNTSVGYLRNAIAYRKKLGLELCTAIEIASERTVCVEDLRPDAMWAWGYLIHRSPVRGKTRRTVCNEHR